MVQQELGLIQTQVEVCSWGTQTMGTSLGELWWIPKSHMLKHPPLSPSPCCLALDLSPHSLLEVGSAGSARKVLRLHTALDISIRK